MPKITFIGAGSLVFTRQLTSDILLAPALQESTITLMDIDPQRLEQARSIVQATVDRRGLKATVKATTDRRVAVENADYVVTTFQQGGLEAYALDIDSSGNVYVAGNTSSSSFPTTGRTSARCGSAWGRMRAGSLASKARDD